MTGGFVFDMEASCHLVAERHELAGEGPTATNVFNVVVINAMDWDNIMENGRIRSNQYPYEKLPRGRERTRYLPSERHSPSSPLPSPPGQSSASPQP